MDIIGPTPKVLESEGCDGGPEICMCLKPAFPLMVMCTQVWEPLSLDTVGKLRLLQSLVDSGICIGFLAQHPWSEKWKWKIWNFCQYWHDAKRNVKVLGVWVLRLGMLSLSQKHAVLLLPELVCLWLSHGPSSWLKMHLLQFLLIMEAFKHRVWAEDF